MGRSATQVALATFFIVCLVGTWLLEAEIQKKGVKGTAVMTSYLVRGLFVFAFIPFVVLARCYQLDFSRIFSSSAAANATITDNGDNDDDNNREELHGKQNLNGREAQAAETSDGNINSNGANDESDDAPPGDDLIRVYGKWEPRRSWSTYCWNICILNIVAYGSYILWLLSLHETTISANTAIYNSTPAFVYLLSALLKIEGFSWAKTFTVVICVGGVTLCGMFPGQGGQNDRSTTTTTFSGLVLLVLSIWGYVIFQVAFFMLGSSPSSLRIELHRLQVRKSVVDVFESILFLGVLGASCLLTMWPVLLIVQATGYEAIAFPIGANFVTVIVTSFADLFFNVFLFLTILVSSPLFASMGSLFTVPASAFLDWLTGNGFPDYRFIIGTILIVAGVSGLFYLQKQEEQEHGAKDLPEDEAHMPLERK